MKRKRFGIVIATCALLGVLWLFLAGLLGPSLIHRLYVGDSFQFFNAIFSPQRQRSLAEYVQKWHLIAWVGGFFPLFIGAIYIVLRNERVFERVVGNTTAENLGFIRVIVCAILLANTIWEDLPSVAMLPTAFKKSLGLFDVIQNAIPYLASVDRSSPALLAIKMTGILSLTTGILGIMTRLSLPIAFAATFLSGGILRQYSHFFHPVLMPMYILFFLCFTPCADGLSVDNRLHRRRALPFECSTNVAQPIYGWCRFVCYAILASAYFSAGFSKLMNGGIAWLSADSLRAIVFRDSVRPMHFDLEFGLQLVAAPDWIWSALAVSAVVIELGYISVLFSGWARQIMPVLAALLHVGILVLQNLLFFDLIVIQLIFVDYSAVRQRLAKTGEKGEIPHTQRAGVGMRPSHTYLLLSILGIVVLYFVGIVRLDLYPFTTWGMMSAARTSTKIRYVVLLKTKADGTVTRFDPDRYIGAMKNTRYRDHLWRAFSKSHEHEFREFIGRAAFLHNRTASTSEQITHVALQEWEWDYKKCSNGPKGCAILVRQFDHDIKR